MHEGEFNNQISPLHEQLTDQPNGVKMVIDVQSHDVYDFSLKIREQLAYFSNTYIMDQRKPFDNGYKIYENDLFKWSEMTDVKKMHLCLGEVYYPMDFEKLGIGDIYIPVAVKLALTDKINPTLSRESLMLKPKAKEIILEKIKVIANWFIGKYNEEVKKYKTFPEAFPHISRGSHSYTIENEDFYIDTIKEHSTLNFEEPTIEGVTLRESPYYKNKYYELVGNWDIVAHDNRRGRFTRKNIGDMLIKRAIDQYCSIVKVNYTLSGNLKEYLRQKHGVNIVYIQPKYKRSLNWYMLNLGLLGIPKDKWRNYIKEYQFVEEQIFNRFEDEFDLENKEEYKEWLIEKIRIRKENKEKGVSNYEGLNKQKGQITINTARSHTYTESVVFNKVVIDISELNRLGKLSVIVQRNMDRKELYGYIRAFPNIAFSWIGEREIKHIKENKHFITMDEFKQSKPFARLATALLIEDILELVPDNEEIIYSAFPKFDELKQKLVDYNENEGTVVKKGLREIILQGAKDNEIWDTNIYSDVLEFQKIMSKFGFLSFIDLNNNYSEEQMRVAKNLVYIMLKWQKIEGQLVTDMELVPKVPQEVFIQEEGKVVAEEEMEHV